MPRHMSGGKINGSHSTVIEASEAVVKAAQNAPEVTKIRLGYITAGIRVGRRSIKITPIVGGGEGES